MKNYWIVGLLGLSMSVSAFAADTCSVASQKMQVTIEYQNGPFSYETVGQLSLNLIEGRDSSFVVQFAGESAVANITVTGTRNLLNNGQSSWKLAFTRQDENEGQFSNPVTTQTTVTEGATSSVQLSGWYGMQMRNIRLDVQY